MDFIQIILGRYLLEFLGALIRYIYINTINLIRFSSYTPFSKIWPLGSNTKKKDENSSLNHMIGVIFFGIIIFFLIIFMV
ncbi:hypothetical protein SAMN06265346_12356 [Flavobacterium hercynium]|uniref:Uncharacterized protein n=1 Tax=Flavobacterium hercynium TaxID=387094 RepID=A0A226HCD0_9FLAO|nr:hypothetical protein B0A66_11920 [Flavobacterium hercynium]SMP36698.1 hypothetical protein SAMN06265346_12356 [Flavobacterium hercynium]